MKRWIAALVVGLFSLSAFAQETPAPDTTKPAEKTAPKAKKSHKKAAKKDDAAKKTEAK